MASNVSAIMNAGGGDDLTTLLKLLSMTQGTKGTTTSTETVGADVSPDVLQAILKRGMEENMPGLQGAAGQKGAGLYNSTTNSLLQNDLLARLTAEAAKLSTKQTKTNTVSQESPAQLSPKTLGTGAGAAILAKQLGLFDKDSILNSLMKQGQNALIGGGVNLAKKFAGDVLSGGYGFGSDGGVGSSAVNLPQVFEQHPIFTGDGLPVAGMGFNDPAAIAFDGGLPTVDLPTDVVDMGGTGLEGFTQDVGIPGISDLEWLTQNFGGELGIPSDLTELGNLFDFDPTNLSGAGLDAINGWIDSNLGGVLGTGIDTAVDSAGALADAAGTSILDQFWW